MLEPDAVLQGRYRILSHIGKGGMGTVYLAKDQNLGVTVAVKQNFFDEQRLIEAFKREARLLAGLRHSVLTQVKDYFIDDTGQYLVMEYIPGDDLWTTLENRRWNVAPEGEPKPLNLDSVERWAEQLLEALDYLHTRPEPVIHRDIKPQNLKVAERDQIILLDFGLAKGKPMWMTRVTTTGSLYGYTPSYAPIEQIRGVGTDPRSDLYALGATLYHLITGLPPVDAATRADAFLGGEPDPLRPANEVNPRVPLGIAEVLMKTMEPHRNNRPSSAAETLEMLRAAKRSTVIDWQARQDRTRDIVEILREREVVWPTTELEVQKREEEQRRSSKAPRLEEQKRAEKLEAESKRQQEEQERSPREKAEKKLREEAEQRQRREEARARQEAERLRLEQDKAKREAMEAEALRQKVEAERRAREDAEKAVRERLEQEAKVEAERQQREEHERKAREKADQQRQEEELPAREEFKKQRLLQETERKTLEADALILREANERRIREEAERNQLHERERAATEWAEDHLRREEEEREAREAEEKLQIKKEQEVRESAARLNLRIEEERKAKEAEEKSQLAERLRSQQEETRKQIEREDAERRNVAPVAHRGEQARKRFSLEQAERLNEAERGKSKARERLIAMPGIIIASVVAFSLLVLLLISWFGVSKEAGSSQSSNQHATGSPNPVQRGDQNASPALKPGSFVTPSRVVKVALSDDARVLVSAGDERLPHLWVGANARPLIADTQMVKSVAVSPNGEVLAAAFADSRIILWRITDAQVMRVLEGHQDEILNVGFSPDGERLFSAGHNKTIKLWRVADGSLIKTVTIPNKDFQIVCISPDMETAAFYDGSSLILWSLEADHLLAALASNSTSLQCGNFSKDGKWLAIGRSNGDVQIFNLINLSRNGDYASMELGVPNVSVVCVAFSADNRTLAVGLQDGAILLYSLQRGNVIRTLSAHTRSVNSMAFSADGTTLVSGSSDKSIRVWDVSGALSAGGV